MKKLESLGQPDRAGSSNRSTEQIGQRAGKSRSNLYREAPGSGYGDQNNFYGAGSQEKVAVDSAVVDPTPIRAAPVTI